MMSASVTSSRVARKAATRCVGRFGDKADRVRQDRGTARRQLEPPHGRVEGGEQHVAGSHRGPGQPVEQRRFAGIGVADQRHHRIRHPAARFAVQGAGPPGRVELAFQPRDALADQPPVDFELALAGTAEKTEPAALALQMGPGTHQPRALIGQRRQFDLQAALMGARPRAEDLQDQAGAVDHLGLPAFLEIALLHRRQGAVDDDEPDLVFADQFAEIGNRPAAEQARRARTGDARDLGADDVEVDRLGEADRLLQARFDRSGLGLGHAVTRC